MPEVQKPVLEHAPTETRKEEITRGTDVVNLVTNVTGVRKTDCYCHYKMGINFQTGKLLWMTEPVYSLVE